MRYVPWFYSSWRLSHWSRNYNFAGVSNKYLCFFIHCVMFLKAPHLNYYSLNIDVPCAAMEFACMLLQQRPLLPEHMVSSVSFDNSPRLLKKREKCTWDEFYNHKQVTTIVKTKRICQPPIILYFFLPVPVFVPPNPLSCIWSWHPRMFQMQRIFLMHMFSLPVLKH